jgi:hypothetical protein
LASQQSPRDARVIREADINGEESQPQFAGTCEAQPATGPNTAARRISHSKAGQKRRQRKTTNCQEAVDRADSFT